MSWPGELWIRSRLAGRESRLRPFRCMSEGAGALRRPMRLWPVTVGHGLWVAGAIPRVGPSGSMDPRHCRRGIALLHERPISPRRLPTAEPEGEHRAPCEAHRGIPGVRRRPSPSSVAGVLSVGSGQIEGGQEAARRRRKLMGRHGGWLGGTSIGARQDRCGQGARIDWACSQPALPCGSQASVTPIGSCHHPMAPAHPLPRPVGRGGMSGFPSGKRCVSRVTLELGRGCVLDEESYNIV